MTLTLTQAFICIIIAASVGCVGELIAGRHLIRDFVGASLLGLLSILFLIGVLHLHFTGEPSFSNSPLISSVLVAAIFVTVWSGFAYRR